MKTTHLIVGSILLLGTIIVSCNKAEVVPAPTTAGTEISLIDVQLQAYLESKVQTFDVDATTPTTIYGNQGTKIVLSGSNFSVTGNVKLELLEIYKKSDMVLMNKVTIANQGGQQVPISSAGEFRLTVTQNGIPVTIVNDIDVSTVTTSTPANSNMELFGGTTDADGNVVWDVTGTVTLTQDTTGWGVDFPFSGDYNWVNCDYFWSNSSPQTSVTANLPSICNQDNTHLYLVFTSENAATGLYPDSPTSNVFSTGAYYSIPEGVTPHFVVVTVDGTQLKYAVQQNTIGTNHVETITSLTNVGSLAQLGVILDAIL